MNSCCRRDDKLFISIANTDNLASNDKCRMLLPLSYRVPLRHQLFLRRSESTMKAFRLAIMAVICSCFWGGLFPAFAQTGDSAPAAPADSQTTAPSGNPTAPTLEDLGISPQQAQGNAQDQARLDKRSHMLKIHQRLGLIDTIH